jgi:hypothetical protein
VGYTSGAGDTGQSLREGREKREGKKKKKKKRQIASELRLEDEVLRLKRFIMTSFSGVKHKWSFTSGD